MSFSYDRYERQRRRQTYGGRSTLGYWVPLVLSVTVATIGVAAWIWSERRDDDDGDDDYDRREGEYRDQRVPRPYGPGDAAGPPETDYAYRRETETTQVEDEGMFSRVSGALRRTPSPQQIFDSARGKVAAGMTAAGAAVGGALSSIREEDKDDFGDHSRWSEEAESRQTNVDVQSTQRARDIASDTATPLMPSARQGGPSQSRGSSRKRTVAVVVSADSESITEAHDINDYEHASILSHLSHHINADSATIYVLIYVPDLKQHPLSSHPTRTAPSITSSYSNIGQEDLQTPNEEAEKPLSTVDPIPLSSPSPPSRLPESASPFFSALYTQAQTLVDKETMILPFTTKTGHVNLLRHLAPEVVYIQESLSGEDGDAISQVSGWVGQVVIVVGDEDGHGGLVDSEDDSGAAALSGQHKGNSWWEKGDRVGLGKGIEVVEGLRIGEDWARRVGGKE
ncbi:MAG: hypothetical protein M1819_005920 [Sarea resinae]|nr:MAG: hypothetical protein M1819_005920 [Sarea resinae]